MHSADLFVYLNLYLKLKLIFWKWYRLDGVEDLPQFQKFILFNEDNEVKQFIESCFEKSDWFLTQLFHSMMISILKWFMANTSINGLILLFRELIILTILTNIHQIKVFFSVVQCLFFRCNSLACSLSLRLRSKVSN